MSLGQIVFLLAWVFLLCALVAEGYARNREREMDRRHAAGDMDYRDK